jgi:hypothetical protein
MLPHSWKHLWSRGMSEKFGLFYMNTFHFWLPKTSNFSKFCPYKKQTIQMPEFLFICLFVCLFVCLFCFVSMIWDTSLLPHPRLPSNERSHWIRLRQKLSLSKKTHPTQKEKW